MKFVKRVKHVLRSIILTAAIAAAGVGAGVAPAVADDWSCPAEYTCIWNETNYAGAYSWIHDSNTNFNFNMSDLASANNRASSLSTGNIVSCRSYFFENANWDAVGGKWVWFYETGSSRGASRDPMLSNGGGNGHSSAQDLNNLFSSNQYVTSCS
ncbi:peptidase inhibitor family I36 protein [Promicromonospora alba]|uniref:Peptidase inhibitor family I36 protein n=1 Tax=Promicromonospora alba TaxID=1616110 RepID=A0ABV9HEI2_9MICO